MSNDRSLSHRTPLQEFIIRKLREEGFLVPRDPNKPRGEPFRIRVTYSSKGDL